MILLEDHTASEPRRESKYTRPAAIALFGVGLIGSAIHEALTRAGNYSAESVPTPWTDSVQLQQHLKTIGEQLRATAGRRGSAPLAVVWSAGSAGFNATPEATTHELAAFEAVLQMTRDIARQGNGVALHLVSSAGGLFEGTRLVEANTAPSPQRPYGDLKLAQEQLAEQAATQLHCTVYRPSSIFGSVSSRHRMGLIPTLVVNGALNRVTTITGDLATLRDYVWVRDLATHIARRVRNGTTKPGRTVQLLASGKPTSIAEARTLIERVLHNRKLLLAPQPQKQNAQHITFSPTAIAPDWHPTALETSCRALYQQWLQGGLA
ncbi:MAG: NAD(P)-dependent oxidoreductase [Planctomycetota bacterium]